jgi:hypothetical protein
MRGRSNISNQQITYQALLDIRHILQVVARDSQFTMIQQVETLAIHSKCHLPFGVENPSPTDWLH